jgi:S1-C subfamily serine protease
VRAGVLALVVVACLTGACASAPTVPDRGEVLRRILSSTVQLRTERDGGVRRAGSGVVLGAGDGVTVILTTRHFLDPPVRQQVWVTVPGSSRRTKAEVTAISEEADLALVEVRGLDLPAVVLRDTARLGGDVWVVGFPWGRRLTVAQGVVSQIASDTDDAPLEGPARMVSASVSYGVSGGGVFDAEDGALIAIVEGYRTARVSVEKTPERTVDIPVPGETTVVSGGAIRRFLSATGRDELLGEGPLPRR